MNLYIEQPDAAAPYSRPSSADEDKNFFTTYAVNRTRMALSDSQSCLDRSKALLRYAGTILGKEEMAM